VLARYASMGESLSRARYFGWGGRGLGLWHADIQGVMIEGCGTLTNNGRGSGMVARWHTMGERPDTEARYLSLGED
jgi:hypothetical protein